MRQTELFLLIYIIDLLEHRWIEIFYLSGVEVDEGKVHRTIIIIVIITNVVLQEFCHALLISPAIQNTRNGTGRALRPSYSMQWEVLVLLYCSCGGFSRQSW